MQLPGKMFYTLADLETHWFTNISDIHQWLIYGNLLAATWLPIMSVFKQAPDSDLSELCHWEGFIRLSEHQCRRLFRNGKIALREFVAFDGDHEFQLPEPADDIAVDLEDIVILAHERKRFEARYPGLNQTSSHSAVPATELVLQHAVSKSFDPTYRSFQAGGHQYYFGEIQARIIRLLAEAIQQGKPWQSGKTLLQQAGSQSYSLSNVFKRHPIWKQLIQSDRRGYYRLNETFVG